MESILNKLHLSFLSEFINNKNVIIGIIVVLILIILKMALEYRIDMNKNNKQALWSFPARIISFVILTIMCFAGATIPLLIHHIGTYLVNGGHELLEFANSIECVFAVLMLTFGYILVGVAMISIMLIVILLISSFYVYFIKIQTVEMGEKETDEEEEKEEI